MPLTPDGVNYGLVQQIGTDLKPVSGSDKKSYPLLSSASSTGSPFSGITGGDYVWRVEGNFGGGTVTLQVLGLDGSTWLNVRNGGNTADVTATQNTSVGVGIGQGATVRAAVTGATGANLNSTLSGL